MSKASDFFDKLNEYVDINDLFQNIVFGNDTVVTSQDNSLPNQQPQIIYQQAPQKEDNLPLYLGIGGGALMLVLIIVLLLKS